MPDQTYDEGRARNLEQLLRTLAQRIRELDATGALLDAAPELARLIGDVRSELFHYEVRATYDTPEVAESRRIVSDAIKQAEQGGTCLGRDRTDDDAERETEEDKDDDRKW